MRRLARKKGSFLPVGELLDARMEGAGREIPVAELQRMEWAWLAQRLIARGG
jgi:hypothetical protein